MYVQWGEDFQEFLVLNAENLKAMSSRVSLRCVFFLHAGGCVNVPSLWSNFCNADIIIKNKNVNSRSSGVEDGLSFQVL